MKERLKLKGNVKIIYYYSFLQFTQMRSEKGGRRVIGYDYEQKSRQGKEKNRESERK